MFKSDSPMVTEEQVAKYEVVEPLLNAMFREFQDLAKKKPDGALNKRKVAIANRLLQQALDLVQKEPSRPFLDLLDEDDLPQNSDVVLILGQAVAALDAFKKKYYGHLPHLVRHDWLTARNAPPRYGMTDHDER